ncbi:MAG: phosphatase PAP2 family protein [Yersinia sp. (in: enterobacteria)]
MKAAVRYNKHMFDVLVKILADGAVLPVVAIGVWALLFQVPKEGRYQAYCRILMAGLTAYLLAKLIGSIYQPELQRPFELLGVKAGASFLNNPGFPSDHILFCTAITLAVWFETRMKRVALLLAGLTLLVAIGRVVALVHTPLDVVGGAVIASVGALWYLQREPVQKTHHIRHRNGKETNADMTLEI